MKHFHTQVNMGCQNDHHTHVRCRDWPPTLSRLTPLPVGDEIVCVLENVTCKSCREIGLIMTAGELAKLRSL